MLWAPKDPATLRRKAGDIYGAVVTQARRPEFYAKLGVQDTPIGRYDMVVLHLFLVLERLGNDGPAGEQLQRLLIEAFVADMDDSLRELGTGDVGVAKKVRRAAAGFYERSRDYRAALADGSPALEQALAGHGLVQASSPEAGALARYVRATAAMLEGADVQGAQLAFPDVPTAAEDRR